MGCPRERELIDLMRNPPKGAPKRKEAKIHSLGTKVSGQVIKQRRPWELLFEINRGVGKWEWGCQVGVGMGFGVSAPAGIHCLNSRKSVTWSAVPSASLVSLMLNSKLAW